MRTPNYLESRRIGLFVRYFAILSNLIFLGYLLPVLADSPVEIPPNWQRIGPYGGRIVDFEYSLSNPEIVYCLLDNTEVPVYRSQDGGISWEWVDTAGNGNFITFYDIAISPNDPDIVLYNDFDQFYRTTDFGTSWTAMRYDYRQIEFDKSDGNNVYGFGGIPGLDKSTDAGVTWQTISDLRIDRLEIDPYNGQHLVMSNEDGVYSSIDGGLTWSPTGYAGDFVTDLCLGNATGTIYATGYDYKFYKSDDFGLTWEAIYEFPTQANAITLMMNDEEELLYAALSNDNASDKSEYKSNGVYRSDDGGYTWINLTAGWTYFEYVKVATSPVDANRLMISDRSLNFHRSFDGGQSWKLADEEFPGMDVHNVAASMHRSGVLLASVNGPGAVMKTTDGGKNWFFTKFQEITPYQPWLCNFAYNDPNRVYTGNWTGLFRSDDEGMNWREISPVDFEPSYALAVSPADDDVVMNGGYNGEIARSTDGGATWDKVYDSEEKWEHFADIAFVPLNPGRAYALKENWKTQVITLLKSTDSGATWQEVSTLPTMGASDLAISYTEPEIIYFCDGQRFFKSMDLGMNFIRIEHGFSYDANYCVTSEKHPNWVWILDSFDFLRSTDQGSTWEKITTPLPYEQEFGNGGQICLGNKANPSIFIGTQCDGIWIYPDSIEPQIMLAGTSASQNTPKSIRFMAYIPITESPSDVQSVDILYDRMETGLQLFDDGSTGDAVPNDGFYTLELPWDSDASFNNLNYSIIARNKFGLKSPVWPYLMTK